MKKLITREIARKIANISSDLAIVADAYANRQEILPPTGVCTRPVTSGEVLSLAENVATEINYLVQGNLSLSRRRAQEREDIASNSITKVVEFKVPDSVVVGVEVSKDKETLTIRFKDGSSLVQYHYNKYCYETVSIEDIAGDLNDLIGHKLTVAECVSEKGCDAEEDSRTWTFVKFGHMFTTVTIRWYGTSNGFYSEKPRTEIVNRYGEVIAEY